MTEKEVDSILQSHNFIVEKNGIPYKFVDSTVFINNEPFSFYMIEETEKGFYFRTTRAMAASNPLQLLVDNSKQQKRITLIDEYKDEIFCTLISQ